MAISSDKASTTNIAKSHSSGEFRWRDFTFFENCKDFCRALFLLCPHSLVCCNPIPKKGFFSLGIQYVFPGVPESAMAAANQLNAAPESHSHLTVSQHFHLAHLLLTKKETLPLCKLWLYWTPWPFITQHCHRHCHASW